jgi:hypothetical protein
MYTYFQNGAIAGLPTDYLNAYPHLLAHQKHVLAFPKIAEYYAKQEYVVQGLRMHGRDGRLLTEVEVVLFDYSTSQFSFPHNDWFV